jgi:hypothetical protein
MSTSIPFPQHGPPTHKRLFRNLTLGRVGEYSWTIHALAPFFLAPTSSNTTSTFITVHLKSNGYFPFFLEDYEPNQDLEFFFNSFKLTFQHMPHVSTNGHFRMVFEHL